MSEQMIAQMGLDSGIVLSINEITNWIKDHAPGILPDAWMEFFNRALPFIPCFVGIGLCFLLQMGEGGTWGCIKTGFMYGVASNFIWRVWKTGKGE